MNDNRSTNPWLPSRRDLGRLRRALPYLGTAYTVWTAYELYLRGAQEMGFTNLGPWVEYGRCPFPPAGPVWWKGGSIAPFLEASGNQANGCLALQVMNPAVNQGNPWDNVTVAHRTALFGIPTNPAQNRGTMVLAYGRPDNGPFELPVFQPARSAVTLPVVVPARELLRRAIDPMRIPISTMPEANLLPAVPWQALPYWQHPNREAVYHAGHGPKPIDEIPLDWSRVVTNGRRAAAPSTHLRRPPPSGTKERKLGVPPSLIPAIKLASFATEALDFIDVLYNSLPDSARARWKNTPHEWRNPTVQAKLQAIFDNTDIIDPNRLVDGLISEHFEDMLFGKMGQFGASASKRAGLLAYFGLNSIQRRQSGLLEDFYNSNPEE